MFIIVDPRAGVREAFSEAFAREGVSAAGLAPHDFDGWFEGVTKADLAVVEGILLGESAERPEHARIVRRRGAVPLVALIDVGTLDGTLNLFAAGVDDVVRKPVHVRELMARCRAIRRRQEPKPVGADCDAIRVFFDGRDPEVAGEVLALPRRERRILEHLVANRGRRVTKAQIFTAIYGLFDDDVEESVVESHVSKLRKKLRARLGYDPVESKRFLGYCLVGASAREGAADAAPSLDVRSLLAA